MVKGYWISHTIQTTNVKSLVHRSCRLALPKSGLYFSPGKVSTGPNVPFFNNYRPQFYFRTTDVTGVCELPAGTEMCMPGDNVEMTVELIHPVAMEQGLRFAIREGGRTVGSGRVVSIIE